VKRTTAQTSDAIALMKLVYQTAQSMTVAVADVLAELDLTESQASMLWALDPSTPPVAMREVARKLQFDPSNITLLTDRLVERGLVERRPHPTDGRQRVLALTDKGIKVWRILIDRLQERSPIFNLSEPERARLAALLTKAHATTSLF
jgi:DNA-binding MarR family transcriptional regulator